MAMRPCCMLVMELRLLSIFQIDYLQVIFFISILIIYSVKFSEKTKKMLLTIFQKWIVLSKQQLQTQQYLIN